MSAKVRLAARIVAVLAVVDAALCLGYTWSVTRYVRPPEPDRTFDVVVVFAADSGRIGYRTYPLLEEGARLLASGSARRLICAGGNRPASGYHGCAEAAKWLIARGVAADKIVVDTVSRDTLGNVREAARLGRELGAGTAILLSHSWHAPRVRAIAAAEWPGANTLSVAPSLVEWSRARYAWEAWCSTNHEIAAWLIWKVAGEQALAAVVSVLRP